MTKSAVDLKYGLLIVDLFTPKTLYLSYEKKDASKKRLEQFYNDISTKRKPNQEIRLQTDQDFQQNAIKRINAAYDITIFSKKTRVRKAFAKEQNIRELKKFS